MNEDRSTDSQPSQAGHLRREAEQRLRASGSATPLEAMPEADVRALLHELQVHHIELEMQNEELLRAQIAAQEASEKYQDLFDFAPAGYLRLDEHSQILEINLAGAALLGLDRSKAVKQRFIQHVAPRSRERFAQFANSAFATDLKQICEIELCSNEEPLHVILEGIASRARGGTRCLRVTLTDISERKLLEETRTFLTQSGRVGPGEDFFRTLARHLALSLGKDFVCIDRLTGDPQMAQTVAVYHDGGFEDEVSHALNGTLRGEVAGKEICCFPRGVRVRFPRDELLRRLQAEGAAGVTLFGHDGKPVGLIALISRKPLARPGLAESVLKLVAVRAAGELERKDAEEALQASHDRLTRVLESITDAFFSLDRDFRLTYINHEAERMFRRPRQDLLGRNLWEVFPEAIGTQFQREFERALAERRTVHFEEFYPAFERWCSVHAYPCLEGLSVYFQDVTDRKRVELQLAASLQELREAQDELVRRERLAMLGSLAGRMAHELRTPLTVIQNSLYFLESDLPSGRKATREVLAEIKRAVSNSDHIITELLDFVREPSPNRTVFPAGEAISAALQEIPLPDSVHLHEPSGETAAIEVQANQAQVTRILLNLIQNAVHAMPQGGDLEIGASRQDPGKVCIKVRDTGCGIPPDDLERIFEPLFSTKTVGIGLGLPIARRFAQFNGGHLSVESQIGCGTTVRLWLNSPPAAA